MGQFRSETIEIPDGPFRGIYGRGRTGWQKIGEPEAKDVGTPPANFADSVKDKKVFDKEYADAKKDLEAKRKAEYEKSYAEWDAKGIVNGEPAAPQPPEQAEILKEMEEKFEAWRESQKGAAPPGAAPPAAAPPAPPPPPPAAQPPLDEWGNPVEDAIVMGDGRRIPMSEVARIDSDAARNQLPGNTPFIDTRTMAAGVTEPSEVGPPPDQLPAAPPPPPQLGRTEAVQGVLTLAKPKGWFGSWFSSGQDPAVFDAALKQVHHDDMPDLVRRLKADGSPKELIAAAEAEAAVRPPPGTDFPYGQRDRKPVKVLSDSDLQPGKFPDRTPGTMFIHAETGQVYMFGKMGTIKPVPPELLQSS